MSGPLSVTIPGFQIGDEYVLYAIVITKGESTWTVRRRYQDFAKLHEAMKKVASTIGSSVLNELPELPPKTLKVGTGKFAPEFVEERRQKLEEYLQRVISILDPERVEALDDFLVYAEHWLREAVTQLADVREIQHIVKLLKQAATTAANISQGRASSNSASTKHVSSSDTEDAAEPGGGSKVHANNLRKTLNVVVETMNEYAKFLRSDCEDREAETESIISSNSALTRQIRGKQDEISEGLQVLEGLRRARQQECDKERAQLRSISSQARTVAAELYRVASEQVSLRQIEKNLRRDLNMLRNSLQSWEKGKYPSDAKVSVALNPQFEIERLTGSIEKFSQRLKLEYIESRSNVSVHQAVSSYQRNGPSSSSNCQNLKSLSEISSNCTKSFVGNGPTLNCALLFANMASDSLDLQLRLNALKNSRLKQADITAMAFSSNQTAVNNNASLPLSSGVLSMSNNTPQFGSLTSGGSLSQHLGNQSAPLGMSGKERNKNQKLQHSLTHSGVSDHLSQESALNSSFSSNPNITADSRLRQNEGASTSGYGSMMNSPNLGAVANFNDRFSPAGAFNGFTPPSGSNFLMNDSLSRTGAPVSKPTPGLVIPDSLLNAYADVDVSVSRKPTPTVKSNTLDGRVGVSRGLEEGVKLESKSTSLSATANTCVPGNPFGSAPLNKPVVSSSTKGNPFGNPF